MTRLTLALAAIAIAGAAGLAALAGAGAAAPPPGDDPTPTPVVTPAPTQEPGDAMPMKVDLENATGHDVYVDIVDRSGRIVRGSSGTPNPNGASVDSYTVKVENVDPTTLRLTWSDTPGDNALALHVDESGLRFILVQPEKGDSDLMPYDRILVLEFDEPISAADVTATLQDGLDV